MSSDIRKKLEERWSGFELKAANDDLAKGIIPQSPFGLAEDNSQDFRGLQLSAVLRQTVIDGLDLSYATNVMAGQFNRATVKRCTFQGAALETNIAQYFEKCDFTRSKLVRSSFRGSFIECNFSNSNISSCRADSVNFRQCIFDGASIKFIQFTKCVFEDCSFMNCKYDRGSFAYSKFANCSFSEDIPKSVMTDGVSFA